jgi:hypothetical protein
MARYRPSSSRIGHKGAQHTIPLAIRRAFSVAAPHHHTTIDQLTVVIVAEHKVRVCVHIFAKNRQCCYASSNRHDEWARKSGVAIRVLECITWDIPRVIPCQVQQYLPALLMFAYRNIQLIFDRSCPFGVQFARMAVRHRIVLRIA